MGSQYQDIDLNEDPCIFPNCGHFVTKTSMDGVMDMKAHYVMPDDGDPTTLSGSSEPFSMDEIKVCPTCRGSLRNIARYGRIVRRAMLDEATKKFITWSNAEYLKLAQRLSDVQQNLSKSAHPKTLQSNGRPAKLVMAKGRIKQLYLVRDWVGYGRYKAALALHGEINKFIGKVREEEQPLQRVFDFVQHAARQRQMQQSFTYDGTLFGGFDFPFQSNSRV